jgi:uncharacterized membrane protein
MMSSGLKIYLAAAAVVTASFAASIAYYPFAPERIISHWNAAGVPDGYMSRFWGLFLLPLISAGLALLLLLIPSIDPLKANVRQFRAHYDRLVLVFLLYMLGIHLVVVLWNAGVEISFNVILPIGAGLLFFYIGTLLKHTRRNWFIGIRTPWTLSSDAVWEQTHRLGARLFKVSGVIALLGAFFGVWAWLFILAPVGVSALWTVVYSYLVYRRLESDRA